MTARRNGRRRGALLIVALGALAFTACEPQPPPLPNYTVTPLTAEGADRYDVVTEGQTIRGRAPATNTGTNTRIAGLDPNVGAGTDQEACITWTEVKASMIQPGVALRVKPSSTKTRAIIVTNNIMFGARWFFNVHLVTSNLNPAVTLVGTLEVTWSTDSLPWRICGRAVGNQVTVKAWPISTHPAEPAWNDPAYAKTLTVPDAWVYSGRPGFYMGHLAPGEQMAYTDPRIVVLAPPRTLAANEAVVSR
jgi:hypothetical protein